LWKEPPKRIGFKIENPHSNYILPAFKSWHIPTVKGLQTILRCCPIYSIADDGLYIGIIKGGEGFVSRLEIKNFTILSVEGTAAAENLTSVIPSNKDYLVRVRNAKGFCIVQSAKR